MGIQSPILKKFKEEDLKRKINSLEKELQGEKKLSLYYKLQVETLQREVEQLQNRKS